MPKHAPLAALAALAFSLASLSLGGCGIWSAWECGYGGPGCGEPRLAGLCEATLVADAPVEAMVVYHDDTGSHEATLRDLQSDTPELLRAEAAEGPGSLLLTPLAAGEVTLTLEVEGWEAPRSWTLTIVDAPSPAADDEPDGEDPAESACEQLELDPDPESEDP